MFVISLLLSLCLVCTAMPQDHTADGSRRAKPAPTTSPSTTAEVEADIRQAAADFAAAFARGDAAALAAHWTVDGDYVDEYSQRFVGRAAIQAEYEMFFADNPATPMQITVDSVRMIGPNTAIEDGRATLELSSEGPPVFSRYTAVHVKQDGRWLMTSVREMRVETTAPIGHIADLEWLIGEWHSEHEGVQLNVTYRWLVDKRVLERTHQVTEDDRVTSAGSQITLWDPTSHAIKSWIFSSCGGYAVGVWSAHESGWCIETIGVTSDGTPTSATNILSRIDDHTLSWNSTGRALGDSSLPASDEVVLRDPSQEKRSAVEQDTSFGSLRR